MNISDITNSGVSTAKQLKSHHAKSVNDQESRISSVPEQSEERPETQDSVAISEEARKAHAAEQKRLQELEFAREALASSNELSAQRKQEIQDRLNSGFYTSPEVLEQTAARITNELNQ